jgi:hypothetical protein
LRFRDGSQSAVSPLPPHLAIVLWSPPNVMPSELASERTGRNDPRVSKWPWRPLPPLVIDRSASRRRAVIERPSFRLLVPSAIILANYVAQIPYDLHLYGTSVSARGGGVLVLTLMWFVAGLWLLLRGNPAGYWLTMSFLATDFGFYLYNLVGGWVHGYGLFFHVLRFSDPILWTVFMIGYANFFATGYLIVHLIRNRPKLPMRSGESSARTR